MLAENDASNLKSKKKENRERREGTKKKVPVSAVDRTSASTANSVMGARCTLSRPLFDINFLPPLTAEPTGLFLSINEMLGINDVQETSIEGIELEEIHQNKVQSQLDVDRLCETMSTQLENHKLGKGGTWEVDLIKTPEQKPRRKKHRPKVIIEGQSKITPKPRVKRPSDPQETTKGKRRNVWIKGVNNPTASTSFEREINETDAITKPSSVKGTMNGKRKYVRREEVNTPAANTLDQDAYETTDAKTVRQTGNSCRRSLKYDFEGQGRYENRFDMEPQAQNINAKDHSGSTMQHRNGREAKKNEMSIAYDLARPMKKVVEGYQSKIEGRYSNSSPISKTDFIHDKERNTVQVKSNAPLTRKSPSDSDCSSSSWLIHERDLIRRHKDAIVVSELCRPNSTETFHNSMQAYSAIFGQNAYNNDCTPGIYFPAMYNTNRIEKGHNSAIFHNSMQAYSAIFGQNAYNNDCTSGIYFPAMYKTNRIEKGHSSTISSTRTVIASENRAIADLDHTLNKQQNFGFLSTLGPTVRLEEKRSKEIAPVSNLRSPLGMCKQVLGSLGHGAATSKAVDTGAEMATKKRSKRKLNINSTLKNMNSHHQLVTRLMGLPLAKTWICRTQGDSITEQCDRLDLNAASSQDAAIEHNTFMAYHMNYQGQCALVPRQRNRPLFPFESSFYLGKRRQPQPKVDLDDETDTAWKLLLENMNSEGIDGMDEENEKWWEEERRVFYGRVDSFIARMHLVQGDRRFSPWKGSVLDSVIGVFLTQNVSDHLSSSAFISLAARFPSEPVNNLGRGKLSGFSKNGLDASLESTVNKATGFFGVERDLDDTISSQNSVIYSHNSADSIIALTGEKTESCSLSTFEAEPPAGSKPSTNSIICSTSHVKLSRMEQTILHGGKNRGNEIKLFNMDRQIESISMVPDSQNQNENQSDITCSKPSLHLIPSSGAQGHFDIPLDNDEANGKKVCEMELSASSAESATQTTLQKFLAISCEVPKFCSEKAHSSDHLMDVYQKIAENVTGKLESQFQFQENNYKMLEVSNIPIFPEDSMNITGNSNIDNSRTFENKEMESNLKDPGKIVIEHKAKRGKFRKEKNRPFDWDSLRKQVQEGGGRRERTANTMDSVDWDAVRCADVKEIAQTIKERGMNNMLAERIKDFLNRLIRDHGSIDLEWLRETPPDKAKEYLLSVRGLGLKSVECVRLLTLHHLAFPVDTNVARIAVRLGWVPLQPLPESLQLHLLELYPLLDSIQKYLWPRLCKLDQRKLYELHYQMITFGKVFCTKSKPNCNACPMRGECRHFASSRLALLAPEEKSIVSAIENNSSDQNAARIINSLRLPLPQANQVEAHTEVSYSEPIIEVPATPEPFVEVPATPESDQTQLPECDIEDKFEDPDDIPAIQLNMEELTHNLQEIIEKQMQLQDGDMSKGLVALTLESASIPMPKLKNVNRLRTEHQVYEIPDSHPLLQRMDKRETDDPCSYLLAIWTPGETADSIQRPETHCSSQESGNLCTDETCFSCNTIRERNSQTIRGTLLIPCRTAMRGSFPLNGTYFQVNEVLADHESSLNPINIPRDWLWNLPRRTVYFGTSIPTIFKGLSTEVIQCCFWRGFVCVRGFDRKTRTPRPLIARLHFPASKLTRVK